MVELPKFNALDPNLVRNPYPIYEIYRKHKPRFYDEENKLWYVTKYEDGLEILKNPIFSAERAKQTRLRIEGQVNKSLPELEEYFDNWALFMGPPRHTYFRGILMKAFNSHAIHEIENTVDSLCDRLLEPLLQGKKADIIQDLANPLPIMVIATMLGVPTEDYRLLKEWSQKITILIGNPSRNEKVVDECIKALRSFELYLTDIINFYRKSPKVNFISELIKAQQADSGKFQIQELIGTCTLLLFAGHETTTNVIGNGILNFIKNPREWEIMQKNPDIIPHAVEECLRYDPPVQSIGRFPTEDIQYKDMNIKKSQPVHVLIGSTNRDEDNFSDGEQFKIERHPNKYLSFGYGAHFCVGANLSKVETKKLFLKITKHIRKIELAVPEEKLTYLNSFALRGLSNLPIYFELK